MCRKIIINRGEKEIETPRQFLEHFGFLPQKEIPALPFEESELDLCLCGFDIEGTFTSNQVAYVDIRDDLFVGELDLISSSA